MPKQTIYDNADWTVGEGQINTPAGPQPARVLIFVEPHTGDTHVFPMAGDRARHIAGALTADDPEAFVRNLQKTSQLQVVGEDDVSEQEMAAMSRPDRLAAEAARRGQR